MKAAIIGTGRIGYSLEKDPYRYHPCTHAGTIAFLETAGHKKSVELTAACDTDQERLHLFQKWYKKCTGNNIPVCADSSELIRCHPQTDLLVIATPVDSHESIVIEALKSGIDRIIVEKPVSFTADAVRKILRAKKEHQKVFVNFERRYHRNYLINKSVAKASKSNTGLLNELRHVHGRVLTGSAPSPEGGGPLLHDAIHWIDLLFFTCGLPESVSFDLKYSNKSSDEHTAHLTFHYKDFLAELISESRRRYFEFFMQLDFKDGRIISSNTGHEYYQSAPSKNYKNFMELQGISENRLIQKAGLNKNDLKEKNPWIRMYRSILTDQPECMLDDMIPVHSLIDACYRKRKGVWTPGRKQNQI